MDTRFWDQRRNAIASKAGKWVGGQSVHIREKSLFDDLFNQVSYMQLMVLNITGKMISPNLGRWLENNFMVFSYPDARIWCNQLGAIAGTMSCSPMAGTVIGVLGSDSRIYGSQTGYQSMKFLIKSLPRYQSGITVEQMVKELPVKDGKPALMGFVRPVDRSDERIEPHRKMTKSLGFDIGPHMQLANEFEQYMLEHYGIGMNIGGYTAAFLADQEFTPEELYRIRCICVANGVTACYGDNYDSPENSFLPMKCEDFGYFGAEDREWD